MTEVPANVKAEYAKMRLRYIALIREMLAEVTPQCLVYCVCQQARVLHIPEQAIPKIGEA